MGGSGPDPKYCGRGVGLLLMEQGQVGPGLGQA
jgi:hypothetical protein